MPDDADAIARVLDGDDEAFRALIDRHAPALFAWLRWYVPDATEREDVAQETFLAAWRRLSTFDALRGSFRGWLLTIGRSLAFNAKRRKRPLVVETPHIPAPSAESAMHAMLDEAVAALPEGQRAAFLLAEVYDVPLAEVASLTGVALGTVKSRLARARARLRAVLDPANLEMRP